MPGINASFQRISKHRKPIGGTVYKYVYDQLVMLWRDSVVAFVNAAVEKVHIDTGMSRASFRPLAEELRFKTILAAMLNGKGPKKPYVDMSGVAHPNIFKAIGLGARLGKKAYTLNFGYSARPVFQFEFDIVVYQYAIHEFGQAGYGGNAHGGNTEPWNSLEAGKKAFLNYFHDNFKIYVPKQNILNWLLSGV